MSEQWLRFYRWLLRQRMRRLERGCRFAEQHVYDARIALDKAIAARRDCATQLALLGLGSFQRRTEGGHRPPRPLPPRSRHTIN